MNRFRKWWIAAAGGVALAAALGAGAVMAQTPVPGTAGTGTTLMDRIASKLGIDSGTLRDAVKSSETDEIDAKVQAGELTQAQGDQLKQRIANAPDDALAFGGGPGMHPDGGPGGFANPNELAQFLGVTADQLRTELQASGSTLATVAQAHGKSRDELKVFLTDEAKAHLAEDVTEGHLTQAQADAKLVELTANLDSRIDGAMPLFVGHGPRDEFPDGNPSPSTTPGLAAPSGTSTN